jgi:prolyl-tRNA synthetase
VLARRLVPEGAAAKETLTLADLPKLLPGLLEEFQDFLLARATEFRDTHTRVVDSWDDFAAAVATGWARAFHCGRQECEDDIKAATVATPRCVPFDAPDETGVCVRCDAPAAYGKRVVFGRAY